MKNRFTKLLSLVLAFILCAGMLAACGPTDPGSKPVNHPNVVTDEADILKGITDDTIWVGNTAGTTGAISYIGKPFNIGIQAAFSVYNNAGGYNGKSIKLKHYDDGALAENSGPLLEKLLHTDEVFAIVGHFGGYAVSGTLSTLIDEEVPMIYAAAGIPELLNENAHTLGEMGIVPIQPLNETEGRMLILRAFAPTDKGGLGATKVGVIADSDEASQGLLKGIKNEMANLSADRRNNIIIQEVKSNDYSGAVNALKAAGCDTVILTVSGNPFKKTLTTMADAKYNCNVLTSYNNASVADFNLSSGELRSQMVKVFETVNVFAQAWLDISSDYEYSKDTALFAALKKQSLDEYGVVVESIPGFTEEYWSVAEHIYDYVVSLNDPMLDPLSLCADPYALAGYIAGDLFCQAMEELEKSGLPLARANLVHILESKEYKIAMSDTLSFANGMRAGVQSFALTWMFDTYNLPEDQGKTEHHSASMVTVHGLMSIEEYRALLSK